MKKRYFILLIILSFIIEIITVIILVNNSYSYKNDTIKINELSHEIELNFSDTTKYPNYYDYSIIDDNGNVIYSNSINTSKSLTEAYKNKDTIVDINIDSNTYKILINNNLEEYIKNNNSFIIITVLVISIIQLAIIITYFIYLQKNILNPFKDMKAYATRISSGDLDIPLTTDKGNNFGAFTESFDIMREELKKARKKEKEANDTKRELVAKLSHDIKTPVSSIKSTSELGSAISKDEKNKYYFDVINAKADQINTLVSNLLISSLEDLDKISISPKKCESFILYDLIKNSDYLAKVLEYKIPQVNIYIDRIRLQQVIDNIISNSYKYANTNININSYIDNSYLCLEFIDYGSGVDELELPLLTEKFKRGSNSESKDGTGLGLYISKTFINEMDGIFEIKNGNPGFIAIIKLRII